MRCINKLKDCRLLEIVAELMVWRCHRWIYGEKSSNVSLIGVMLTPNSGKIVGTLNEDTDYRSLVIFNTTIQLPKLVCDYTVLHMQQFRDV